MTFIDIPNRLAAIAKWAKGLPLDLLPALAFHDFAQFEQTTSAGSKPNFAQARCFATHGASLPTVLRYSMVLAYMSTIQSK